LCHKTSRHAKVPALQGKNEQHWKGGRFLRGIGLQEERKGRGSGLQLEVWMETLREVISGSGSCRVGGVGGKRQNTSMQGVRKRKLRNLYRNLLEGRRRKRGRRKTKKFNFASGKAVK